MRRIQVGQAAMAAVLACVTVVSVLAAPAAAKSSEDAFFAKFKYDNQSETVTYKWPHLGNGVRYQVGVTNDRGLTEFRGKGQFENKLTEDVTGQTGSDLALRAVRNGVLADEFYVSLNIDPNSGQLSTYQVSTRAGIRLTWPPSATPATVSRDGEVLIETKKGAYADPTYSDKGAEFNISITASENGNETTYGFNVPPNILPSNAAAAMSNSRVFYGQRIWTRLRYTTFIPEKMIDSPPTCLGRFHNGNNRGFGFGGGYKTQVEQKIGWYDIANSRRIVKPFTFVRRTEPSIYYNSSRQRIGQKTASPLGARRILGAASPDLSSYSATIKHSIGNPLCPAVFPNIDYTIRFTVKRNGFYSITGSHKKVPNHEIHITQAYNPSLYRTASVYKKERSPFICLQTGVCPTAKIGTSGNGPAAF